jgi:hypothetical protein
MAYVMHAKESGRPRRPIIGPLHRALAATAVVLGLGTAAALLASCVEGVDDDRVAPTTGPDDGQAGSADRLSDLDATIIDELAFAASRFAPATDPTGAPYLSCSIRYDGIDWSATADEIVQAHRAASAVPCAAEPWYHATAFQNGILTFMALVGEQALTEAAPVSDSADAVAASLLQQGFDRLAAIDVISSGRCERGQVQVALFTLAGDGLPVEGLDGLLDGAAASGATVEPTEHVTVISGGGAGCATAIIHGDRILGWVTSGDTAGVREAVAGLRLGSLRP